MPATRSNTSSDLAPVSRHWEFASATRPWRWRSVAAWIGRLSRATGKRPRSHTTGLGVFKDLPNPFPATRYHSLATIDLPDEFDVVARSEDDVVQAVRHRELPITGVQFHPESVMTPSGKDLLANFLNG